MRDLILPWAVMAVTIAVAIGLMAFFRGLLRQRDAYMEEFTKAVAGREAAAREAMARHDLAA